MKISDAPPFKNNLTYFANPSIFMGKIQPPKIAATLSLHFTFFGTKFSYLCVKHICYATHFL